MVIDGNKRPLIASFNNMADNRYTEETLISSIATLSNSISLESSDFKYATQISRSRLATYIPRDNSDDTVKVLTAFIDHLPPHGKRMMLHLIQEDTPDKKLFDLSFYLSTTILIPTR
jgi:hypothetical protein